MTREQVAARIRWAWIIWFAGLVNVVAMLPQLIQLVRTHQTEGLSLTMFVTYFWIQLAFSIEGYFTRNKMLMICLALSTTVSVMNIALIVCYRYG